MKDLSLREHLAKIQSLGGKARWKDVKPDPNYFRELNKKSHEAKLAKKIKKEIEEESKENIIRESYKQIIK